MGSGVGSVGRRSVAAHAMEVCGNMRVAMVSSRGCAWGHVTRCLNDRSNSGCFWNRPDCLGRNEQIKSPKRTPDLKGTLSAHLRWRRVVSVDVRSKPGYRGGVGWYGG